MNFLMNKWTLIAVGLLISHGWLAWTAYDYAQTAGEAKAANLALEQQIRTNEINLEIARRREANLNEAIERANAAARENARQKVLDDKMIDEYDNKIEELLNDLKNPDDECFDADFTRRMREQWQTGGSSGTGSEEDRKGGNPG